MATVSAPGTGSGIDVAGLVSQLIAAEGEPTIRRLDRSQARFEAQFSALGRLKSALAALQGSVETLTRAETFATRRAESGDETRFTATASQSAVPGTFDVRVLALAEAQRLASAGFADAASEVGSGRLVIAGGGQVLAVDVAPGAGTLGEIRDAINAAAGASGIAATLVTVDDGAGGLETRLSLSAPGTGTANALTVTVVDDDEDHTDAAGLSRLVYDPDGTGVTNLTEVRAAADARIEIDDQPLTAGSNTIDFAIDGVTLNLVGADPDQSARLGVTLDHGAVSDAVAGFVGDYNALRVTLNELTGFDADTQRAGVLIGDAGVRIIASALQRELGTPVDIPGAPFAALSELGISTQRDGTLALDAGVLAQALAGDAAAVGSLFASAGGNEGVAVRLARLVEGYVGTQGVLDQRSAAITARLDAIADQRVALERRLADREESLLAQFAAMDRLVAELSATSDFLTTQLSALSALSSRNGSDR